VAYAPSQAKTHLIDASAATVLQMASKDDVTVASLLQLYSNEPNVAPAEIGSTGEQRRHLDVVLAGLLSAGLLRPTT
jgi:hypothetical protein